MTFDFRLGLASFVRHALFIGNATNISPRFELPMSSQPMSVPSKVSAWRDTSQFGSFTLQRVIFMRV